jgi:bisphosphoglycerate-dependent phosphoglycerate mutase
MKLILVRHGESEFNKLIDIEGVKMFCGATDVGLTEHGKNQAKYLDGNDKLKDISKYIVQI